MIFPGSLKEVMKRFLFFISILIFLDVAGQDLQLSRVVDAVPNTCFKPGRSLYFVHFFKELPAQNYEVSGA